MTYLKFADRLVCLLLLAVASTAAHAQTREWTGTTGSWFDTANWSGMVLPTAADSVDISNGGTATVDAGGAVANTLLLANSSNSSGFINVSGVNADLVVTDSATIGRFGAATVNLDGGASMSVGGSTIIGDRVGFTGRLTASGSSSSLSLDSVSIGQSGPGEMGLSDGIQASTSSVVIAASDAGLLHLRGAGTTLQLDRLALKGNATTGANDPGVLIEQGAVLDLNDPDSGSARIERGIMQVTGAGSEFTTTDTVIFVGVSGNGRLQIDAAAQVTGIKTFTLGIFPDDMGVLGIGSGGAPGTLAVAEVRSSDGSGMVNFNHNAALYHFSADGTANSAAVRIGEQFGGGRNISVNHTGPGMTVLRDTHFYTGATTIDAGELRVDGTLASAITVNAPGTLSGTGATSAAVGVANGATVAPGNSIGTFTSGALTLNDDSQLNFEFGAPGNADRIQVNGDLTLDGVLNMTTLAGFASGSYRLFDYTGTLTDNTLTVTGVPADVQASVDTSTPGQVNLDVITPEPAISITPANLDFADIVIDTTSETMSVTIASSGTGTLEISAIASAAPPFMRNGGDCPAGAFMLPVGNNCTITYQFAPTAVGPFMQTIAIDSDALSGPDSFDLQGEGVAPALTVMPALLDFGDLAIGAAAAMQSLTLENTGSGELLISTLAINGIDADDFSLGTDTCGNPLAFGQSCMLEISFDPAAPGVKQAVLQIDSNAPASPTEVVLTGSRDVRFADGFEAAIQP